MKPTIGGEHSMAKENPPQNFQNHVRNDPKLFTLMFLWVGVIVLALAGFLLGSWVVTIAMVLAGVAGLLTAFTMRVYAVTVQDRVVMVETRLRLERILDGELAARVGELTRPQLVGLRFASDAEMNDLVRKTLEEGLATAKEIKQLVKDWQADYHRV
jgi:hypothetical protein